MISVSFYGTLEPLEFICKACRVPGSGYAERI